MSILTGNNPFADYKAGRPVDVSEAKVELKIDDKEDQKTKQKENDKPASPEEIEKGTDTAASDVASAAAGGDDMAGAGEEGMPDPENPGDLNGDGVVDMKDKKIAELEKDLRIRELERGIADIDDPEVEPGLKKAAPERPRIKNRGDHYAIIDDKGEELEKIPFDNKKTSAREARYQALRRVDAIAMELQADHTAGIKDDPDGKLGEIDKQAAKDMEKANGKLVKAGADKGLDKGAAADQTGKPNGENPEATKPAKKEKVKEDTLEESAKIMKMLKGLDKDEARVIIQGLPKNLRKKAMKHIGLKEEDVMPEMPDPKVDGRTKAYRETARRIQARKAKKLEEMDKLTESLSDEALAALEEEFPLITERRMFIAAARAAFAKGDKTFLFNGKEYPCTVKEAKKGQKIKVDGEEYEITDIDEMDDEPTDGSSGEEIRRKEMRVNEARRRKNEAGEEEGPDHIMMQMRKAVSLRSYDLQFTGGKKMKIKDRDARKILQMYDKAKPNVKVAIQKAAASNEKAIQDLLRGKIPEVGKSKGPALPTLKSLSFGEEAIDEAGYEGRTQAQGSNSKGKNTGETPRSSIDTGTPMPTKAKLKEYSGTDFYADYIKRTTKK